MYDRTLEVTGAALCVLVLGAAAPAHAQGLATGALFTATNDVQGNAVMVFQRSASGGLTHEEDVPTGGVGTGGGLGNQGAVTLDRPGQRLLVVNAGDNTVSSFRVGPAGLELADVAPSGGERPISVTIAGDLAYVLNAGGDGNVTGFHVAVDGTLTPRAGSEQPLSSAGAAPAQIAFGPDGRFLVVTEKATQTIVTYAVDGMGLAGPPVVSLSQGLTPFGFSFDNQSRLLVSEASGGAAGQSTVSSYTIESDGTLTPITSALATTQSAACWLVSTVNGHFAYVTNTGSDTVTGLAVEPGGSLALLQPGGVSASTGDAPIDATVTRNGRYLYVLDGGDDTIHSYAIHADGSLTGLGTIGGLPSSANGLASL